MEYDWGCSKLIYRRKNNVVPKSFHMNVMAALACLTRRKRLLFARRARTYRRAQRDLHRTGKTSFKEILKKVRVYKTHRNAGDFDSKAIKAVIDGDNGGEVDHPGTQAHRETYARAVAADKQRAAVYAEATVTAPSAGRKRKARAVDVETESAQLRKQQQKQALAQWTKDVRARIADSQAMMRVSDGGGQVVCEQ
eukprot:COSAG01_NODE_1637_length_9660_cov_7.731932_7_plen_195_part_00